jgi:carboxylesterase type B
VFTPTTPPPPNGFAVMFWLYGGGALQFGSSSMPIYDASIFAANEDVVVITSNYRSSSKFALSNLAVPLFLELTIEVYGFPGNVDGLDSKSRNLGFLDQKMALQWTQDNIAKFGGKDFYPESFPSATLLSYLMQLY